jgi:HemK-like putative methylase
LNIIDFCTGTGCIPLLLYAALRASFAKLTVRGVDISPTAVALANLNIEHNANAGNLPQADDHRTLSIVQGDVFDDETIGDLANLNWDILVSNPPYVSKDVWNHGRGQLGYSVRKYEPRLALVPGDNYRIQEGVRHEDTFYARLLDVGAMLKTQLLLLEIGDEQQALRVARLFCYHHLAKYGKVELWRDWPDLEPHADEPRNLPLNNELGPAISIPVKGSGNLRAVAIQIGH